jgi:hypothetical protein
MKRFNGFVRVFRIMLMEVNLLASFGDVSDLKHGIGARLRDLAPDLKASPPALIRQRV